MANYADSRRNALQWAMTDVMSMPEFKRKEDATLKMFLANGQTLISSKERELIKIKKTDSDTVEANILIKPTTNAVTARSYTHSGNIGDSDKATISFVTRGQIFKWSKKQADRDSVFTLEQMKAKLFLGHIGLLLDTLETYYLAYLSTNKSQVSAEPSLGSWDGTNYLYRVPNGDADYFFQRTKGFMRENYYKGALQLVGNEAIIQRAERLMNQGAGNSENLAWQLSNIEPFVTTELSNDDGYLGMAYVIPKGTVGLEQWIPDLNIKGDGHPNQLGGMYYSIPCPYGTGFTYAVHEIAVGADNNGAAGETQDVDVEVEISIDTAPVKAIMTTSNASPIFKAGLVV